MSKKNVAYIFDMEIECDNRTQKEIYTLINSGYNVKVFEWNKDKNYDIKKKEVAIRDLKITIDSIGIRVKKNCGIKQNFLKLLKYEIKLFSWFITNVKQYDIIHCVNLDTAYISKIISIIFRKKMIYDIFDDYADSHCCKGVLYKIIKRIDYKTMKKSDYTIICSEKRRNQIIKPVNNIVVIHNSPDIEIAEKNIKCETSNMKIAYIGNLTDNRMLEELLEIVSTHKEFELHCGGAGPLTNLVNNYSSRCENIFFYGRMKYEDVISLEMNCDIIPAIYDPNLKNNTFAAPNKFYEAMSLGKATIMVHNTGMDNLVEEYSMGKTIDNNKESLENALIELHSELEMWKKRNNAIKKIYNQNYSWNIMKERLLKIYNNLGE